MISSPLFTELGLEHWAKCRTGHFRVEEVTETIRALVFTRGVVRVGQTSHEDDASFLTQRLHGDSHTRRRAAGDHDCFFSFDHPFCRGACCIRLRLRIARDVFDFLAENTVPFEVRWLERVHHAAVAFTVEVFDSEFVRTKFVSTFVGICARLWDVKAERDAAAFRGIQILVAIGPSASVEKHWCGKASSGRSL